MSVPFITTDKAIAVRLRTNGFAVAGTLDEQAPKNTFYVAYSDWRLCSACEYVTRKLPWNIRVWNDLGVVSIGWYGSPEAAVRGVARCKAIAQSL